MTEAVGTISAVIDIVDKVTGVYVSLKDAPDEVLVIEANVGRVRGLLQAQLDTLRRGDLADHDESQVASLVTDARKLMETSSRFLDSATTSGEGGKRKVRKLKWFLKAAECKELGERFKTFYQVHSAVHGSLTLCV